MQLKVLNLNHWINKFSKRPWFGILYCMGSFTIWLKTKILFPRWREFQWFFWCWRNLLSYTGMYFILNLVSCMICITYFSGTVIEFVRSCKRPWIVIIFDVTINLVCGGWDWYGWRPIKGNHRGTTITSTIMFWWGFR